MENYKIKLGKRIKTTTILIVLSIVTFLGLFFAIEIIGADNFEVGTFPYISGFICGIMSILLIRLISFKKALKDETLLKKQFVKETDERELQIQQKTNSSTFKVVLLALAFSSLVIRFFDLKISSTLMIIFLFILFIRLALEAYYKRKL